MYITILVKQVYWYISRVSGERLQDIGPLVEKELVILLFECVVGKCFVVFCVFSFPPAVYVGTLNLIASIPGPSILTLKI